MHNRNKILLVEDEKSLANDVINYLSENNYKCTHTNKLSKARDLIKRNNYDAVLLDLGLPDGDGLSLIRLVSPGGLSQLNDESEVIYTSIMSSSEATMDLPIKEVLDPIKLINNFKPSGVTYDFGVKLSGNAMSSFNDYNNISDNHLEASIKNINVVVFSDADFIRNAFWARIQKFLDTNVIEATSDLSLIHI